MEPRQTVRGLRSGRCIAGALRPPGSKSVAQRVLLAAAAAEGTCLVDGLPGGEDVEACHGVAAALGAGLDALGPGRLVLRGRALLDARGPSTSLVVGESGTLARLASALAALALPAGTRVRVEGRGTLLRRTSPPLFEALRSAGVGLHHDGPKDGWPLELVAAAPPDATLTLRQPGSSQEASALLLALAARGAPGTLRIEGRVPSRPYFELTLAVLRAFGVALEQRAEGPTAEVWSVRGALRAPARFAIESDASAGAVALAAACLSGGFVRVEGVGSGSWQTDARIVEHLAAFGCDAWAERDGLFARGAPTRGAALDLSEQPDLAPVLAIVAAAASRHGASRFSGLETLRGKESDRLAGLARGLSAAGFAAREEPSALAIGPAAGARAAPAAPLLLDPGGDHRMAFAFALLGLLRPDVLVHTPDCVSKSWPSFWEDLAGLGADVVVRDLEGGHQALSSAP